MSFGITRITRSIGYNIPLKSFSNTPSLFNFSTSSLQNQNKYQNQSTSSSSIKDPSHPNLYYHSSKNNPTHLILSFLPNLPINKSKTILGYLPLKNATFNDFKQESRFLDTLHDAIKLGLENQVSNSIKYEAETRPTDGWIHITDERAIPPAGRIGETEDLIGSVYVQNGKIISSTYSPLPTYRLVTPNGVLTLPRGLDTHLINVLKKIDEEERK
ncbi:uncharacterized protein I206_101899 [Kwoniella pini CBS 10737]|uniref:Uncharacterized protein n=1 Tax=Kwoniella pini CBS 10737 TaxID=1296096 RepID=A0A1B9HVD5_9TREE|nr:uncharacterized protein I206_07010 [Kwoniella pini CBS 10737]OCF47232.1 hypothetical protein I206_07010 [Kwoniella pini CBS 10737]